MPTLYVLQGPDRGHRFQTLEDEPTPIGRESDAVPISDHTVSRRHAEIRRVGDHWEIEDLKSANGTLLNSKRVERPTRLKHGDQIRMGSSLLVWGGDEPMRALPASLGKDRDLIDLDVGGKQIDTAIIGSVASADDSVIMASPVAADAVRAWRVMSQLGELIATAPSPDELLDRVMDIIYEELPIDRGFILMKDEKSGELLPHVIRYRGAEPPDKITTSRTIIDHVMNECEGLLCTNAMTDERFVAKRRSDSIQAYGIQSVICVPIIAREEPLGVIHIDTRVSKQTYTDAQLRLVTAIGRMTGLAVEDAQLVAERMKTERLAATGETVAALSHHIKNILQGLRSGADVVEMGLSRQQIGTIDKGWQIVQRNLDKIFSLTMNMLAFSKTREPRLEMAQLNTTVGDSVNLVQRRADDKAILLLTDFEDNLPPIPMDVDGIHQVVMNLVSNAIDAVAKSTGAVNVKTRFDQAAQQALIIVADNGPGIPKEKLGRVLEPFYSTKGQGGTGLGLAVARKIVTEHHGRIEVQSEPDAGTIFTVRLPVRHHTSASDATHGPA
ncbi:MAG: ATP-binding protein, partial [Phycisphaerae bacterium]